MKKFKNLKGWRRSTSVALAILLVTGGVAFALLQSQQDTLTGNTIETATAAMQLSLDGKGYSDSRTGFDFNNLIPGGSAQPAAGNMVFLKNEGTVPLDLKLAVTSVPTNTTGVDLSKVNVILTPVGGNGTAQSFGLQDLMAAAPNGGSDIAGNGLAPSISQEYTLQISMDADAVNGPSASLGNIDLAFNGVAQTD